MEVSILNIVIYVILGLVGFTSVVGWLYQKGVNKGLQKASDVSERIAQGLDGLGLIAGNAGLEKVGVAAVELSDVFDEAGDPLAVLADAVANKKFTKETIEAVIKESKEVWIEGKDFFVKVLKKPE